MATDSSAHIISLRKPKPALTPAERAKACRLRKKRQKTGAYTGPAQAGAAVARVRRAPIV
jgi:hypothetical protein